MNAFAVYARINLMEKPAWLDVFRAKYDKSHEDHVTLKQPCLIEPAQAEEVRKRLSDYFSASQSKSMEISFTQLHPDEHDGSIMIDAEPHSALSELQKGIVNALEPFHNYVRRESETWEKDFVPHVTIARGLDANQFRAAVQELPRDAHVRGTIQEVVLSFADVDVYGKEAIQDQVVYRL